MIRSTSIRVSNQDVLDALAKSIQVAAVSYVHLMKINHTSVFTTSLADIKKALAMKKKTDSALKLLSRFHKWLNMFKKIKIRTLLSLWESGIDYRIKHTRNNNEIISEASWSFLYTMLWDKLLVLRKTLTDLLNKKFIWVSSSSAATPVLFIKKLGDGLRFCVNYRALNQITKKNRYSLSLI